MTEQRWSIARGAPYLVDRALGRRLFRRRRRRRPARASARRRRPGARAAGDRRRRRSAQGSRLPLLVRFADILRDRLARLQARVRQGDGAIGTTPAATPRSIRSRSTSRTASPANSPRAGGEGFGLEAGSKPELMAVLALAKPGSIVICNGYKDREYIRLALIGRKLGLRHLHRDREAVRAAHVIEEARALGVEPLLGVRMRLTSLGAGKWQNTGGDKAQVRPDAAPAARLCSTKLKAAKLTHTLQLLHFHMGSQMSNVRDIAGGMREAVRYFVELSQSWACRSTTSMSAAASASTTKARARARTARSTTAWTNTRRRSCSRSPKPAPSTA